MMEDTLAKKCLGGKKPWCVMVYLAGGGDVSDEARESLLLMKQVGSTDNIHLIAQFDSGSEGTLTKRYYLSPCHHAVGIESLLTQAGLEVPATVQPYDSTVGLYYCRQIKNILSACQKDRLDRLNTAELTALLAYSPKRFKNFVLDCILDEDIYPQPSGNLGFTNAGDPKVLANFIRWAKVRYPADHYMVVVWGHGNGLSVAWDYPSSPLVDPGDSLTAQELRKAFENDEAEFQKEINEFRKEEPDFETEAAAYRPGIDIIGFNSCSLGTIEVYRQLLGLAQFGIASEGFTPKTSWPYDRILKALEENPGWGPEEFAERIIGDYIGCYEKSVAAAEDLQKLERKAKRLGASLDMNIGRGQYGSDPGLNVIKPGVDLGGIKPGVDLGGIKPGIDLGIIKPRVDLSLSGADAGTGIDLSVCNLKKSDLVCRSMQKLVNLLLLKLGRRLDTGTFAAVVAAHSVSQSYFNKDFTDLYDFCRALKSFCSDAAIRSACEAVMDSIKTFCKKRANAGIDVANSYGVSIFFPWGEWDEQDVLARYKGLEFLKETKWNVFLRTYRKLIHHFEAGTGVFKTAK